MTFLIDQPQHMSLEMNDLKGVTILCHFVVSLIATQIPMS
jgi:hypothetical protein